MFDTINEMHCHDTWAIQKVFTIRKQTFRRQDNLRLVKLLINTEILDLLSKTALCKVSRIPL